MESIAEALWSGWWVGALQVGLGKGGASDPAVKERLAQLVVQRKVREVVCSCCHQTATAFLVACICDLHDSAHLLLAPESSRCGEVLTLNHVHAIRLRT